MKTINNPPTDRENLEWLVWYTWSEHIISMTRGAELLGFTVMQMREWLNEYKPLRNYDNTPAFPKEDL